MEALNIDWSQPVIEEKLEQLKNNIIKRLTEGYGYELQDDTLSTWIILIAVRQNKPKNEIQQDLVEFISDNSEDFVDWLWKEVPKLWTPPKVEQPVKKIQIPKKAETTTNSTSAQQASFVSKKQSGEEKQKEATPSLNPQSKSERIIKKAIVDAHRSAGKAGGEKKLGNDKTSSYVTTTAEGRKIINLSKPNPSEPSHALSASNSVEQAQKQSGRADVFQRLKPKEKLKDESAKKSSNLDISLDSVIKQQKQNEFEGTGNNYSKNNKTWSQGQRKRNYYEVTEENYQSYEGKNFKRQKQNEEFEPEAAVEEGHRQYNPRNKYFKPAAAVTGTAAEEEAGEGDKETTGIKGGYKGKKKIPYYAAAAAMPYFDPSSFYGYGYNPMYAMDPYMMGGYYPPTTGGGFKKFKNKSLILNKKDKAKPLPVEPKTEEEVGK